MQSSRVIAIDPSLRNWGMALFDSGKLVDLILVETKNRRKMPKSWSDLYAAREIYEAFSEVCFRFSPDYVVAEIPYGAQSSRGAIAMGVAIGVISTYPEYSELVKVTPREVKLALTGNANATKQEMIDAAYGLYPEGPWRKHKLKGEMVLTQGSNQHMADAVGAYIAGLNYDS